MADSVQLEDLSSELLTECACSLEEFANLIEKLSELDSAPIAISPSLLSQQARWEKLKEEVELRA